MAVWLTVGVGVFGMVYAAPGGGNSGGGNSGGGNTKGGSPLPIVMVLLDTSGSMEYVVDATEEEGEVPVCHDSRQDGFDYKKSRFAVATEVLTGSFNQYWCQYDYRQNDSSREDYNYPIPHVIPRGVAVNGKEQQGDGILDLYRETIKFGLMTFDVRFGTKNDASGGYSYGPDKTWSGMTVNLGARSDKAPWGALTVPYHKDYPDKVSQRNDELQAQILASRPYMGTPIAPMLEDANNFFRTDDSIKKYDEQAEKGDPYYDCRQKDVILITDGQPTLGEGTYGYSYSVVAAEKLLEAGIKVHVVGFQMPASTFPILNEIAFAGGTDVAHIATNKADLLMAVNEILTGIQASTPAHAKTAVTNRTLNWDDMQYQFTASRSSSCESTLDLVGQLDQHTLRCPEEGGAACPLPEEGWDGGAVVCAVESIADALNERELERNIITQLGGELIPFTTANSDLTPDVLGVPASGDLPDLAPVILPDGTKMKSSASLGKADDKITGPENRLKYRTQLIDLVAANKGSRRENIRLGAIRNSQPTTQVDVSQLSLAHSWPSLRAYVDNPEVWWRPTVLFVGTHDAQMHAFRVDHCSVDQCEILAPEYGKELWSFIPNSMLPKLNVLASGMAYLMDGSPVVAEVRKRTAFSYSGTKAPEIGEEEWQSILISGYGAGGRGYFALDVTDPTDPRFLWEISTSQWCSDLDTKAPSCEPADAFARLGNSVSTPAIGHKIWKPTGSTENLWAPIAVFGGGSAIEGEPETGKSVFVVEATTGLDPDNGEVVQEFCNLCGNVIDTNPSPKNTEFLDCTMVGPAVLYDTSINRTAERAFLADSCGQLWRLDMFSANPEEWTLRFFYDAFEGKPMDHPHRHASTLKPSVALSLMNGGGLAIIFATGDPDTPTTEAGARDYVMSLSEKWDDESESFVAHVNWKLELQKGESVSAAPLVFNQVSYFSTQAPGKGGKGLCKSGVSRLWGLDFDGDKDQVTDDLVAALDLDLDDLTDEKVRYQELEEVEFEGLQLIMRPGCGSGVIPAWNAKPSGGAQLPDKYTEVKGGGLGGIYSGTSQGRTELVAQTGSTGQTSPELQPPQGSGTIKTGNRMSQAVARGSGPTTLYSTSWGLLFD
jgi:type IV pilus assembly protein PilY1